MTAFVVFNPSADGGQTGRDWREIEAALEQVFPLLSFFVTTGPTQAARVVREDLRITTPILSLSATVLPEEVAEALEAGMNDTLSKPFEPEKLHQKIDLLLSTIAPASVSEV